MTYPIKIAVINESTSIPPREVPWVIAALQIQLDRDFAPAWGISAVLEQHTPETAPADAWQMVLLDTADQAGALGYHQTTPAGLPLSKVFALTSVQNGLTWSCTASHELLEMLCDPDINLSVYLQNSNTSGMIYAYEVCDPVEEEGQGYVINQIRVSNFVLPQWFMIGLPQGTKYDFMGELPGPFCLAPGGYFSTYPVPNASGWQQNFGPARSEPTKTASVERLARRHGLGQ